MLLISWELWLAREIVSDNPLPWHNKSDKLIPKRVAQAFAGTSLLSRARGQPKKARYFEAKLVNGCNSHQYFKYWQSESANPSM
jgi:hypothetical protein